MPHATKSPKYESASYTDQMEAVTLVRDVYQGTERLRDEEETYLPQHAAERDEDYEKRVEKAVLFNAFKRTVGGLIGMIFRKDPQPSEEVPEEILAHFENIDLAGRDLPTFARDVAEAAEIDGHTFIHVDFPRVDDQEVQTLADERRAGVRPYWVHVLKEEAINWRYELVGGSPVLTLFVYKETVIRPDGEYGEEEITRYRVLRPGSVEVWETEEGDADTGRVLTLNEEDSGETSIDFIPIVPVYTNRTGFLESEPPLLDLAYENIAHWQVRSDHRHALEMASIPIPVFMGKDEDDDINWGPNYSIALPRGGDAKMLETSGKGLSESRQELQDIEARMAALGLQMLVRETRAAETAQAKMIDKAESDSALAVQARSIERGLTEALRMHGAWMGTSEVGEISVNTDFQIVSLDAQEIKALTAMVQQGHLSMETMWQMLEEGEILPSDFEVEMEKERLEQENAGLLGSSRRPLIRNDETELGGAA